MNRVRSNRAACACFLACLCVSLCFFAFNWG